MKNIVWQKPDLTLSLTGILDERVTSSADYAALMLQQGSITQGWVAVLFDVADFPDESIDKWRLVDGLIVGSTTAEKVADLKTAQLKLINVDAQNAIEAITSTYPASEVLSWSKQEQEARAFLASASAATPLIDALAAARGVDKSELVLRIIEKADQFAAVSGSLIGRRQNLEDQIDALPPDAAAEDVEAIQW